LKMETCEYELDEVKRVIAMVNGSYHDYGSNRPGLDQNLGNASGQSIKSRKSITIVRMLCCTCHKGLSDWEVRNKWAYCYSCRRILFPESVRDNGTGNGNWNDREWRGSRVREHREPSRRWPRQSDWSESRSPQWQEPQDRHWQWNGEPKPDNRARRQYQSRLETRIETEDSMRNRNSGSYRSGRGVNTGAVGGADEETGLARKWWYRNSGRDRYGCV
jgi:hypothetical protein